MDNNKPLGHSDWWYEDGLDPQIDDEAQCDFVNCQKNSIWWFQVVCCKAVYLMCGEHVNQTIFTIKTLPPGRGVKCRYCEMMWNSLDYITVPQPLRIDFED